jgi:hypothetical protein
VTEYDITDSEAQLLVEQQAEEWAAEQQRLAESPEGTLADPRLVPEQWVDDLPGCDFVPGHDDNNASERGSHWEDPE